MPNTSKAAMPLPPPLVQFLGEIGLILEAIELNAIKEPGRWTPNTPGALKDIQFNLLRLDVVAPGSASLKALCPGRGSLAIERNVDLAWAVWASSADGAPFGDKELVAAIDFRRRRAWLSSDAPAALETARRVLGDSHLILRGASRNPNGRIVR